MSITIYNDEIKNWLSSYKGEKFHAILCDPPYHLTSITKRFGKKDSAPAKFGTDGVFQRASAGFMGKQWDGGGIAFDPDMWHILGDMLYDGGFLMAYGGTRTYHRMAVAIEDAGFIIHSAIGWVQTMGFPKATRIDTQIDKRLGLKSRKGETVKTGFASGTHRHAGEESKWGFDDEYSTTHAVSPLAKTWEGYRYGLQTLKPSFEFIAVAQRPYGRSPLNDIITNGAGAINIEGGKIGNEPISANHSQKWGSGNGSNCYGNYGENERTNIGRWPANVVMAHLPECKLITTKETEYMVNQFVDGAKPFGFGAGHEYESSTIPVTKEVWRCAPGCPSARLREQALERGSQGNADEVFYSPQFTKEEIEFADKFIFNSKVTPQERNAGCEDLPLKRTGAIEAHNRESGKGQFDGPTPIGFNNHPTLKPIMLNKWLATLLLPPVEYAPRRILVPFAGAMSEAIGCELAGWDEIVAVELEEEYVDIGRERVAYWTSIRSSGADAKKLDKRQLSFDEINKI